MIASGRLLVALFALMASATAFAQQSIASRIDEIYKPGEIVDFRIEKRGKVIGTQHAECLGYRAIQGDSLFYFSMKTKSVFERTGRTIDMDVSCEVGYYPNRLPRRYKYDLKLLNASVTHQGVFTETEYSGRAVRLGVEQPFSFTLKRWPILFDNNFALQWEIAMSLISAKPGDSLVIETMIPQLSQQIPLSIHVQPYEQMIFAGENLQVHVLKIDPANQVLYIDEHGRLLKAVDRASEISVIRQAAGETTEIARKPLMTLISDRLAGYLSIVVIALAWFVYYCRRERGRPWIYALAILSGGLYWATIKVLPPILNLYFGIAINPRSPSLSVYITLFGSAAIFAIMELVALAIPVAIGTILNARKKIAVALAIGAACGIGFGLMQAFNLTSFADDGSLLSKADLMHKFGIIGINAACGAMLAWIIAARKEVVFYLIPIGLKTIFNWISAFMQKGALSIPQHGFVTLFVALSSVVLLYFLSHGAIVRQTSSHQNRTK